METIEAIDADLRTIEIRQATVSSQLASAHGMPAAEAAIRTVEEAQNMLRDTRERLALLARSSVREISGRRILDEDGSETESDDESEYTRGQRLEALGILREASRRAPRSRSSSPERRCDASIGCDKECAICISMMKRSEKRCLLQCGHVFHKGCIKQWLHGKNTCPLDRQVVDVYDNVG